MCLMCSRAHLWSTGPYYEVKLRELMMVRAIHSMLISFLVFYYETKIEMRKTKMTTKGLLPPHQMSGTVFWFCKKVDQNQSQSTKRDSLYASSHLQERVCASIGPYILNFDLCQCSFRISSRGIIRSIGPRTIIPANHWPPISFT